MVSSLVSKVNNNSPYILLNLLNKNCFALLDSGANISVIGGNLCSDIFESKNYIRGIGNVKTANGKRQHVLGTTLLDINYKGDTKSIEFFLIPSITQEVICGMDFWDKFGIKIAAINTISEIVLVILTKFQ